jgi:hypothetical protein
MRATSRRVSVVAVSAGLVAGGAALGTAGSAAGSSEGAERTPVARARAAAERGLGFLQTDAAKWRAERKCASCHHGTMTVWAEAEAKRQGYAVSAEEWAETTKWTRERVLERIDLPRDTRPGWSMVNSMALNLAVMARAIPDQDALPAADLRRMAGHLVRHQEADGAWSWAQAPAKNRPPPFFESDEVATLLGSMALSVYKPADPKEAEAAPESLKRAAAWLTAAKAGEETQALALRLLAGAWSQPPTARRADLDALLKRQNADGGWGQLPGAPSDAYATGQTLYVLGIVGMKREGPKLRRAVEFLVSQQEEDGSWPMAPRAHPGATPASFTVPIVYFGSAWATLGLMRQVHR